MYIYLHKTNNHLCVYMYAYMDTCKVFKQVTWCFMPSQPLQLYQGKVFKYSTVQNSHRT